MSSVTPPSRGVGKLLGDVLVFAVVLAIPLAPIAGGAYLLYERAVGTRVEVTVVGCRLSGGVIRGAASYREDCVAEWTLDGVKVVGGLSGGSGGWLPGDTVDATVRGGTAYARSLGLPLLLIGLGLPFLAIFVLARRGKRRRSQKEATPT